MGLVSKSGAESGTSEPLIRCDRFECRLGEHGEKADCSGHGCQDLVAIRGGMVAFENWRGYRRYVLCPQSPYETAGRPEASAP